MDSKHKEDSNQNKSKNNNKTDSKPATISGKDKTKIPVRGKRKSEQAATPVTNKKSSPSVVSKKRGRPKKEDLNGVSDIRRAFHKNEEPLYFISATNFNLLGADEWIKGFRFITYIECFDGLHPNVFHQKMKYLTMTLKG